jgi:hypothetical protein
MIERVTRVLWLVSLVVATAGCAQGAVGWLALSVLALFAAACARRDPPVSEPIRMVELEPPSAPHAPEVANAAPSAPEAGASAATDVATVLEEGSQPVAEAPARRPRPRVRTRAPEVPVEDATPIYRPQSRAGTHWNVEPPPPPLVAEPEVLDPESQAAGRARVGGRWEGANEKRVTVRSDR